MKEVSNALQGIASSSKISCDFEVVDLVHSASPALIPTSFPMHVDRKTQLEGKRFRVLKVRHLRLRLCSRGQPGGRQGLRS